MNPRDVSYINVVEYLKAKPEPIARPQGWTIGTTIWCAVLGLLLYWIGCVLVSRGWRVLSVMLVVAFVGCARYVEPPHPAFESLSQHCHAVTPARQAAMLAQHPSVIDSAVFDRCMEREKP